MNNMVEISLFDYRNESIGVVDLNTLAEYKKKLGDWRGESKPEAQQ